MVAGYLHHCKQRSQSRPYQITPLITQHHAGYRRRYVGQRDELPYMPGTYDDDEIARKSVGYGPGKGHIPPHPHGHQQYEETGHHHKHQIGRRRKSQPHHRIDPPEHAVRRIRGRNLEIGHTRKQRIGPSDRLACLFGICLGLLSYRYALLGVVLSQHIALRCVGIEISESDDAHHYDGCHEGYDAAVSAHDHMRYCVSSSVCVCMCVLCRGYGQKDMRLPPSLVWRRSSSMTVSDIAVPMFLISSLVRLSRL